jgi:putative hemolysin
MRFILMFAAAMLLANILPAAFADSNPAAVYCTQMGYQYKMEMTEKGVVGLCVTPDGSQYDEWSFLEGKTGEEYSYCTVSGYQLKTVSDGRCRYSEECAVCVDESGQEINVTDLVMESKEKNVSLLVGVKKQGAGQGNLIWLVLMFFAVVVFAVLYLKQKRRNHL